MRYRDWVGLAAFIFLFFFAVYKGISGEDERRSACIEAGGVPLLQKSGPPHVSPKMRGCVSPDIFINPTPEERSE